MVFSASLRFTYSTKNILPAAVTDAVTHELLSMFCGGKSMNVCEIIYNMHVRVQATFNDL